MGKGEYVRITTQSVVEPINAILLEDWERNVLSRAIPLDIPKQLVENINSSPVEMRAKNVISSRWQTSAAGSRYYLQSQHPHGSMRRLLRRMRQHTRR
jgi:hypothetical protein